MDNRVKHGLFFIAGATVSSALTWFLTKKHYENVADNEIAAIRNHYIYKLKELDEEKKRLNAVNTDTKGDVLSFLAEKYKKNEDISPSNDVDYVESEEEDDEQLYPYVIEPDEFGNKDDYDTVSLTYYRDGVIADLHDEVVASPSIDYILGEHGEHFEEYAEDDIVYIRNDTLKTDFEIVADLRSYRDILDDKPYLRR